MAHIAHVPNDGFWGQDLREAQVGRIGPMTSDFGRNTSEAQRIDVVQELYGCPREIAVRDAPMRERNRRF